MQTIPRQSDHENPNAAGSDARSGPDLDWRDGVIPVATRYDDPYFSLSGGLAETRHVFLDGNDLPARLRPGFQVAELGFGTGLNLLALAAIADVPVGFTSFEAEPMETAQIARALTAFPELGPLIGAYLAAWGNATGPVREFTLGQVTARIVIGDARQMLPQWRGAADAWFLDGFSPARNPELWDPALLRAVATHTTPGGSFATYTAAGHVRRALQGAGFAVTRQPGFGSKRHMTTGRLS
ncbi:tRNA (5-methylaminomethyl-2-thiouridine)(34)-methyltransferase MnmD [Paracoccus pacificus]|uniref:tRNA (5-methylaminomethyl-2-thiouridine)(34)-methyltransferase MnmD n=1 Tax=Paracoccus pacificus TaxID=1463598 RepID=A0ABW4R8N7_9RHOB